MGLAKVVALTGFFRKRTNNTEYETMNTGLNLILTGTFAAIVGTASAQLAPAPQQERQSQPPQQQRQLQQPPPQQGAPQEKDPAEVQAKLQELHGELEKISLRLSEIHREALLEADVRKLLIDFERN